MVKLKLVRAKSLKTNRTQRKRSGRKKQRTRKRSGRRKLIKLNGGDRSEEEKKRRDALIYNNQPPPPLNPSLGPVRSGRQSSNNNHLTFEELLDSMRENNDPPEHIRRPSGQILAHPDGGSGSVSDDWMRNEHGQVQTSW